MKEPYGKGPATHPGPESCAGHGNRTGEALTRDSRGQTFNINYSVGAGGGMLWIWPDYPASISLALSITSSPAATGGRSQTHRPGVGVSSDGLDSTGHRGALWRHQFRGGLHGASQAPRSGRRCGRYPPATTEATRPRRARG